MPKGCHPQVITKPLKSCERKTNELFFPCNDSCRICRCNFKSFFSSFKCRVLTGDLGSIHNLPRGWAMMILRGRHSFSLL